MKGRELSGARPSSSHVARLLERKIQHLNRTHDNLLLTQLKTQLYRKIYPLYILHSNGIVDRFVC